MSKTADLRELVTEKLNTIRGASYYRKAPDDANFPYKTFDLSRMDAGNSHRDDIDLCVDIWDRCIDPKSVDEIADKIEELFDVVNIPRDTILPTFFRTSRYPVEDQDKNIQHTQLHFLVELYTKKE